MEYRSKAEFHCQSRENTRGRKTNRLFIIFVQQVAHCQFQFQSGGWSPGQIHVQCVVGMQQVVRALTGVARGFHDFIHPQVLQTEAHCVGDIVEEHVQIVNPKERHYVAIVIPLGAGMEPLNPDLATSPPEARPVGTITLSPTYVTYLDDHVAYYYDTLPAGTFDFYFRDRAQIPGRFVQPPAVAQMMYDETVRGQGQRERTRNARIWDVCYMSAAYKRDLSESRRVFKVKVGRRVLVLWADCGPGDDADPVITIGFPSDF